MTDFEDLFSDDALAKVEVTATPMTDDEAGLWDDPAPAPSGAPGAARSSNGTPGVRTFSALETGPCAPKKIHWAGKCLSCGRALAQGTTVLWSDKMRKPVGCDACSAELPVLLRAAEPWSLRAIVRRVVRRAKDTSSDWAVLRVTLVSFAGDSVARAKEHPQDIPPILEPLVRGKPIETDLAGAMGGVSVGETIRATVVVTVYQGQPQLKSALPPFVEMDDDRALASFLTRLSWVGPATARSIVQVFGGAVDFMAAADEFVATHDEPLVGLTAFAFTDNPDELARGYGFSGGYGQCIRETLGAENRPGLDSVFTTKLLSVRGITPSRLVMLLLSYREAIALRSVYLQCSTWRLTPRETRAVIEAYGMSAVKRIKENPYQPVLEGVLPWATADHIGRQHLDVALDDPRRVTAGAVYLLERIAADSGDTLIPASVLSDDDLVLVRTALDAKAEAAKAEPPAITHEATATSTDTQAIEASGLGEDMDEFLREILAAPTDPLASLASTVDTRLAARGGSYTKALKSGVLSTAEFLRGVMLGVDRGVVVAHSGGVQLTYLYQAEQDIAAIVARRSGRLLSSKDTPVEVLPEHFGFAPDPEQLDAAQTVLNSGFGVLTGGPGTGKTATLNGVAAALRAAGESDPYFLAPTARAAVRVTSLTKCPAATIHRGALYTDVGARKYFAARYAFLRATPEERPKLPIPTLPDVAGLRDKATIVVDESSMCDTLMAAWVLAVADRQKIPRVVFVGDPHQLPSIGPGQVLEVLSRHPKAPARALVKIHRQAESSPVPWLAKAIDEGDHGAIGKFLTWPNKRQIGVFSREAGKPEETIEDVIKWCQLAIKANLHGVRSIHDITIIAAQKSKGLGTEALNRALQAAFCPIPEPAARAAKPSDMHLYNCVPLMGDARAMPGTKVKHKENDYRRGAYNGDVGALLVGPLDTVSFTNSSASTVRIDGTTGERVLKPLAQDGDRVYDPPHGIKEVYVSDDSPPSAWRAVIAYPDPTSPSGVKYIAYLDGELNAVDLAYASTGHEMQGSSAPVVGVVVRKEHLAVAGRAWLYTGVTRTTDCLGIFTHTDAVTKVTDNISSALRHSGLDLALDAAYAATQVTT
jgi:ATP-dependent exoDNAse (exonuclease V) alpha subunit